MPDQDTLAFAHRLADAAGAVIRPFFRQRYDIADKGLATGAPFDPVTAADKGAEEACRALIGEAFPADGILGEEYGETPGTSGRRWVLDPLDGTRAFLTGFYEWGTLIALEENGTPVLGVIDQPVLRERFIAWPGHALRIAGGESQPVRVRACAGLSQAIVTTTHPWGYFSEAEAAGFERLARGAKLSRFGGDCYGYALLAMGHTDLIIEAALHPWDIAALVPVIREAGGMITDWHGAPLKMGESQYAVIAAGDPRVHADAVRMLAR